MPTKTELEQEIKTLRRQLAAQKARSESLKKRVVAAALDGCAKYGWCHEVRRMLADLKLTAYMPSLYSVEYRNIAGPGSGEWGVFEHYNTQSGAVAMLEQMRRLDYWDNYDVQIVEETAAGARKVRATNRAQR